MNKVDKDAVSYICVSVTPSVYSGFSRIVDGDRKILDMVWPTNITALKDLGWSLRYCETTSLEDRLSAASVVAAYVELITTTQAKRNKIISAMKAASKVNGK